MEERYLATVDMGTSKIALCVAVVRDTGTEILFYRERPTQGISVRNGAIFNPKNASVPLRELLDEAEGELGIKIARVLVNLPQYGIRGEVASAKIKRSDPSECISEEEVGMIKDMATRSYPIEEDSKEAIYGSVAQHFCVEDAMNLPEDDIVGMISDDLEGYFKVFIGPQRALTNIDRTLDNAGVTCYEKVFTPITTAAAVLTQEEMEGGVAFVEAGAGVTSLSIFTGNVLRHFSSIRFGGRNITQDIKYECTFSEKLSENIKLAYGACQPDKLQSMSDKIIQVNYEESGACKKVTVKFLSEIITARAAEIIDAILYLIQKSGYADQIRSGIVVSGGGVNLTNFCNLLSEKSGYPVRTGFPRKKDFTADGVNAVFEASAACSVGMILKARSEPLANCCGDISGDVEVELKNTVFNPDPTEPDAAGKPGESGHRGGKGAGGKTGSGIDMIWHKLGNIFDQM